ncbi:MAG: Mss4p nuclear export [Bathelium mastoideum]|nr:MAG: Mss4p nuclear export [Bathelium mastoideum]
MAKNKRTRDPDAPPNETTSKDHEQDEESSDEDLEMLDVEFEFFDPQPDHDFHGLKRLLQILFDADSQLFDLSALVDLILSQPLLGSTVKVSGDEDAINKEDPYAFLTVLNLHEHREKPIVQQLIQYLGQKASSIPTLSHLPTLLSSRSEAQVGLVLTDRLRNMPVEIVPPMYKMLTEEISMAVEEKEPYSFSHYLIVSQTYTEKTSELNQDGARSGKKRIKQSARDENFYFHPEDEVLHRFASGWGNYDFTKQGEGGPDSRRAFQELGIEPKGHMILIEQEKFGEAVEAVTSYLTPQAN